MTKIASNKVVVWIISLIIAVTGIFFAQISSPVLPEAKAHDSGYLGTGCSGVIDKDCYAYSTFGGWYQTSNGYWYRYIYKYYYHYWFDVYYHTSWRTSGYCWWNSYCVNY